MWRLESALTPTLDERKAQGLYRCRNTVASPQSPQVTLRDGRGNKRDYVAFSSNDYLGLANHPRVIEAFRRAATEFGVGSGASHLINGHSFLHQQLEEALADFTGRDRALLFSTGYMANTGTLSALLNQQDVVLQDKLNHASLLDGGLHSGARFQRYLHNDLTSLESRLQRAAATARRIMVVTDGVFSMDGDIAPLPDIVALAEKYHAWLMVDDAHGMGCLGTHGAGCAEYFGLDQQQLPILMGTLGKGFGSFGAFIAGSDALIETLVQFARPYIYTTALPPAVAAASLAALELVRTEHWRRDHLQALIKRFRSGVETLGLTLMPSSTPIQPIVLGDVHFTMAVAENLAAKGFLVGAIRPPTVPAGQARLRVTLSAAHTLANVDDLLSALADSVSAANTNKVLPSAVGGS